MKTETCKTQSCLGGKDEIHLAAGGDVPPGEGGAGVTPTPASLLAAWNQSFQHPPALRSALPIKELGIGVL